MYINFQNYDSIFYNECVCIFIDKFTIIVLKKPLYQYFCTEKNKTVAIIRLRAEDMWLNFK